MPTVDTVSKLRICLLGPFRIEGDAGPIHLPRRKAESLLAYLLLHPEGHSRDALATILWGDSSDAQLQIWNKPTSSTR